MPHTISPEQTAHLLTDYLIKRTPTDQHVRLYIRAVSTRSLAGPAQGTTLATALQHPALLPYLDAYDAFFHPASLLRQHLHLLFSVLEASPDFTELFLPRKRAGWPLFIIAWLGTRGLYRLAVGTAIAKAKGL